MDEPPEPQTPSTCPACGAALPHGSPEGVCPRCLLAAGFESGDGNGDGAGADMPGTPGPDEVARLFPDLEVLEELGRGGMGVVDKARQRRLDRLVALKILPREISEDGPDAARFEDRFTREARALARLSHPHIVAVHEFGEREGCYYFLMEYVDGTNLRRAMRAGRLAALEALAIVPQICDALQYAHEQGVVHRDIKPENILLDRHGRVKIADFGLAKLLTRGAADRTLTRDGLVMGTPHYMAPEQIERPADVDHRADVYSLGVVLYEMLTGELPLGRFDPPSAKVQVDVRLDRVVLRTLEKERERRYQSAGEVKAGIAEATSAVGAPPPAAPTPVKPTLSKLALAGVLTFPVTAVALTALTLMFTAVAPQGTLGDERSGFMFIYVVGAVLATALAAGFLLSIAGLIVVRRSTGRLRGLWMAVAGVLLPFTCVLPSAGLFVMSARATEQRFSQAAQAVPPPDAPPGRGWRAFGEPVVFSVRIPARERGGTAESVGLFGTTDDVAVHTVRSTGSIRWPLADDELLSISSVKVSGLSAGGSVRVTLGALALTFTPGTEPVLLGPLDVQLSSAGASAAHVDVWGDQAIDVELEARLVTVR